MSTTSSVKSTAIGRWWSKRGRIATSHLFLVVIAASTCIPFVWMVSASLKPIDEVEQASLVPSEMQYNNYAEVFATPNTLFAKYYFNSIFVAGWVTVLTLLTSAMAAYAFARLHWPGRDHVFKLYLATMMIPGVVTMIPVFTLMVNMGLYNSYISLIVPAAFSAFGAFMLRQFMMTIPLSLDEAALIDGASHWQVFWEVIVPLSRPGLIVLAVFTFTGNYGSFMWPLILIKDDHLRTMPIGLLNFDTLYFNQINLLMAASVMNIVPLIVLFVIMQKYLVEGIQLGAVKG